MPIKKQDLTLSLMRHLLGSIDLSDIKVEEEMTEIERDGYCAQIFAVFPLIEKDIKKMLYQQLMFISNNSENWEQVIFGRGTFNGLDLLLEKWEKATSEYENKHKGKEGFDKNSPLLEI
jgi:hypothetical protein